MIPFRVTRETKQKCFFGDGDIGGSNGTMTDTTEVYVPQHLNAKAQKRLSAALDQVGRKEDEDDAIDPVAMKMYGNTKNNTKRRMGSNTNRSRAGEDGTDYEEDDDDLEHAKWWGKRVVKILILFLVFLFGVTCFAVSMGVLGEAVKAYHDVGFKRGSAEAQLRNECCRYLKRTLPPEHEAQVEADCQMYANNMCREAEVILAEYWVVQFMRQLAYAYSLCSEGSCYQVLMNITLTVTGFFMGAYKFVSWMSWLINPFMGRRL